MKTYGTWVHKKFRNLDLNEKRDGAATTWYGSSFHIKEQFTKKEVSKNISAGLTTQQSKIMGPSTSSSSEA